MQTSQEFDSYIIDTYKSSESGTFLPGAITFKGRKKLEAIQWKDKEFHSQSEADAFVRAHFDKLGIRQAENEDELHRRHPKY